MNRGKLLLSMALCKIQNSDKMHTDQTICETKRIINNSEEDCTIIKGTSIFLNIYVLNFNNVDN